MVVAMLTLTVAHAENEEARSANNVEAYDMKVNFRKLALTLNLNVDQMDAVEQIHTTFCQDMMLAAYANKDEREAMVDEAVKKDVRYMRYVLDRDQYRKYLILLNLTLQNRGLK